MTVTTRTRAGIGGKQVRVYGDYAFVGWVIVGVFFFAHKANDIQNYQTFDTLEEAVAFVIR